MAAHEPLTELRAYARTLVAEAEDAVRPVVVRPPSRGAGVWRRVATLLSAAVLGFVVAGTAAASDSATPGDVLYPVDRAVERVGSWVGLGPDIAAERTAEANILLAKGEAVEALELAREVAADHTPAATRETVEEAIGAAIDSASEARAVPRPELHAAIAELIAAAHEAPDGTPGAADVVAAAHRVADVAKGGPGEPRGEAVGRNGDPSPESPQRGEGSPASDPRSPADADSGNPVAPPGPVDDDPGRES